MVITRFNLFLRWRQNLSMGIRAHKDENLQSVTGSDNNGSRDKKTSDDKPWEEYTAGDKTQNKQLY